MTNEEAIEVLKNDIEICTIQQKQACEMAIQAIKEKQELEIQVDKLETVCQDLIAANENLEEKLDSIIADIEAARDKDKLCEYPYNRCIDIIRRVGE